MTSSHNHQRQRQDHPTGPSQSRSSSRTSATSVLTRLTTASHCPTREEPQHRLPRQDEEVHRPFGPLLPTTAMLAAPHLLLPRPFDLLTSTTVAAQNGVLRSLPRLVFSPLLLLTLVAKVKSRVARPFGDHRQPINERGTVVRFSSAHPLHPLLRPPTQNQAHSPPP